MPAMIRSEKDSASKAPARWLDLLPIVRHGPALGLSVTLVIISMAWLLRAVVDPVLPSGFPYVTFFPAVIVTSFLFGIRIGFVAATSCLLIAWHAFIPPAGFEISKSTAFALTFYVFVVATDLALVHWMQTANRKLAAEREANLTLADTRELLFRELQHRVSNNLQVAASLLSLQKRQIKDVDATVAIDQAAARLDLIGRMSRQLYDSDGVAQPLLAFLSDICASVIEASGREDVTLAAIGDEALSLIPDAVIPTALVIAEAAANALEHGFAGARAGQITINVEQDPDGGPRVIVHDNGHGIRSGFETEHASSLGLLIATTLARGQGGYFALEASEGTRAILALPFSSVSRQKDGKMLN